jgi:hypothetical protein
MTVYPVLDVFTGMFNAMILTFVPLKIVIHPLDRASLPILSVMMAMSVLKIPAILPLDVCITPSLVMMTTIAQ